MILRMKRFFKRVVLLGDEREWISRQKGLYHPKKVEKFNYYTRWWRVGRRKAKVFLARNAFLGAPLDDNDIPELQMHEEAAWHRTVKRTQYYFSIAEDPSALAWVRYLEAIIIDDDDWEFSDD